MMTAISITVLCVGSLAVMFGMVRNAPLVDANERPVDDITDDPRPAQVLREGQKAVRS